MIQYNFINKRIIICGLISYKIDIYKTFQKLETFLKDQGAETIELFIQRRGVSRSKKPGGLKKLHLPLNPATYITKGKAKELKELCLKTECDIVVFINKLSKSQIERLSLITNRQVICFDYLKQFN